MKPTRNPFLFAFLMVATLFFIWGFCHSMLDGLNKYFQQILKVSPMQSGFIQTSVFLPYLFLAFPAALVNRRIGYQRSILLGLAILATGAFLFIPAGLVFKTFWAFLAALFVLSTGLATIEVAANPYVTVLGPKDGAAGRLSVAQAFNSCAYILAPFVSGVLLFGHTVDPEHPDFHPLILPYVVLGCVVLAIFGAFSFIHLPTIEERADKTHETDDSFKAPLTRLPHFKWGVFAQFLYIISQIGINSFAQSYILENAIVKDASGATTSTAPLFAWYGSFMHAATPEATAIFVVTFAMVLYALGRFTGAPLARVVRPNLLLAIYGLANCVVILLAIADLKMVSWAILPLSWFFMSIMFPFIFAMSIRNLGPQTKIAASFQVMAVGAAGSISAVAMGWLWQHYHNVAISFTLPLIGFIATTIYGLAYPKLLEKSTRAAQAGA